jgi:hypothetical protein
MKRDSPEFVFRAGGNVLGVQDEAKQQWVFQDVLRRITSAICIASVVVVPVLISLRSAGLLPGTVHRPAVAAFAAGAKIPAEREIPVNEAAFFPPASPS